MRRLSWVTAALGVLAVLASGCGSNVCDQAAAFDAAGKKGDCGVDVRANVLGAQCSGALSSCSDADRKILEETLNCWRNLPVCASADEAAWGNQAADCDAKLMQLTGSCQQALFSGEVPGEDAGVDAGPQEPVDAGPQPDTEGIGALDLIATANEGTVALAWTQSQPGAVDYWEVHPYTAADFKETPVPVSPPQYLRFEEEVGTGVLRKYFVVGLQDGGTLVWGELEVPDAGMPEDGGTPMCTNNFECPSHEVCNLGVCEELPCTDSNACPGGYLCDTSMDQRCERVVQDGGTTVDAGVEDAGTSDESKPFISELVQITTSTPTFSDDRIVSLFDAAEISLVAIDTARQFMVMEQTGQLFGYFTENRGKTWRVRPIDSLGAEPRAAFEPQSQTLFTCYAAANGIRVRTSRDFGNSWGTSVLQLTGADPMDGGPTEFIRECAIAPWQPGQAMVTAVSSDAVLLWVVTAELEVVGQNPQVVYASSTEYYAPREPAIATLPSEGIVHVIFTATRDLSVGGTDTDIVGMYRDGTTGGNFVGKTEGGPKLVGPSNAFKQSSPTVVVDPVTQRAVAAWVASESPTGGLLTDTVYLGMFVKKQSALAHTWASGSDLNVFTMKQTAYVVMSERVIGEEWMARSPSVVATRDGRIFLSFLAGKDTSGGGSVRNFHLRPYVVEFDFDKPSEVSTAVGWFLPPAARVSDTRVWNSGNDFSGPSVAVDQQISIYWGFVEGVGPQGDVANRPVVVSRPK